MNAPLQLPPADLARQAVQLSADVYLPKAELEAKYPMAIIREAGCDRVMMVRVASGLRPDSSAHSADSTFWIVFMGTHNLKSLISDLKIKRHNIGGDREVHAGFDNGVEELWPDILDAISALSSSPQPSALGWTAHSRGASQAILAADKFEDWLNARPTLERVWTQWVLPFAPARPGNAAFRDRYNFRLGHKTFFYHHGADIVPWLPGWLMGNRHVGHRLWWPDKVGTPGPGVRSPDGSASRPCLDPSLPPLALNLAKLLCRHQARGLEALLADHHVSTYVKLLTA